LQTTEEGSRESGRPRAKLGNAGAADCASLDCSRMEQGHVQSQRPLVGEARGLYLDLMKKCLTRLAFDERYEPLRPIVTPWKARLVGELQKRLAARQMEIVSQAPSPRDREIGADWPATAETMIGLARLDNVQQCVSDVLERGVPGDLIETGVWRGGTTIFMRAILAAYGETSKTVWVADSFKGLPKPSGKYEADIGDDHWTHWQLAVPPEEVRRNFERYGLLDEQVRFLEGWFEDTLPNAPIEKLAVARLDGDMFESTIVALEALYPKLSVGGYLIVDDYGAVPGCRRAVDEFRRGHGISEPMQEIDWTGAFWQRQR
jgi:O-methyltransferase